MFKGGGVMEEQLRILIAEYEYLILMGLKLNLERLGHKIIGEATDGLQAVELALEKKPDLIIADINMPSLDGIEAIKKINEKLTIPSIIVSGYHDKELIRKAGDAGVFGYLVKPVDGKELKPAIEIAMTRFKEYKLLDEELKNTKKTLEARKYIERAKGILIDRLNIKEAEAMKMLQKRSRDNNKKIVEVARDIIKADKILNFDK